MKERVRNDLHNPRGTPVASRLDAICEMSFHPAPVAQPSKPAVSQVSKPAAGGIIGCARAVARPADLEVGDTAGLETCATRKGALRFATQNQRVHTTTALALLASALVLLATSVSHAFVSATDLQTGAPLRWRLAEPGPATHAPAAAAKPGTNVIRFHLATDGFSATNTANELNAVRAAFGQWQSIPGTALRFEEAGLIPPAPDLMDPTDGTNVIHWAKTSDLVAGGTISLRGTLGLTLTSSRADGTLLGADIVLNGFERSWFTDFADRQNPGFFAETTLLHEIGHLLGLDHCPLGGATMAPTGGTGVDARHGLSADEIAFARAAYGTAAGLAHLGHLAGRVLMDGEGVFGAAVGVEDSTGNLLGATVTGGGGNFVLNALPPGDHQFRVWPLDPAEASQWLIRGADLGDPYFRVTTEFLPTTNQPVTVSAARTNTLAVTVISGRPAFRVAYLRQPAANGQASTLSPLPAVLSPGQSNIVIGVYSPDLPLNGATLRITGDGVSHGMSYPQPAMDFGGGLVLRGLLVSVAVATNATPGLRSLVVQQGTNVAYANGYVKILPIIPDSNFDGVDDTFQRRHFPVFTAPEAGPDADPDHDGSSNAQEYIAATDPTDARSFFSINRVTQTAAGTVVEWKSSPGKRYQVFAKTTAGNAPWTPQGPPVTATGATTQFHDTAATGSIRFYRLQVLP